MRINSKGVFGKRDSFKPFQYHEAYQLWSEHEQMHWLPRSVSMHQDLRDWTTKLTQEDRDFITNVLLLFTQSDVDVAGGYIKHYLPQFELPEIRMMLLGFAGREAIHIAAYSYLNETLGKPDSFYSEFLNVPVLKAKHEFFDNVISKYKGRNMIPAQIAGISAFTEGMMLFSSFVMLLNYPRNGFMIGKGQLITWSILDEQKHVEGLVWLFRTIIKENPSMWNDALKHEIYSIADMLTHLENDFVEEIYPSKIMRNLALEDLKLYNKFIVNKRLNELGLKHIHSDIKENPLPWVDEMVTSQTHSNFFETRETSYAKAALSGSWSDVWGNYSR